MNENHGLLGRLPLSKTFSIFTFCPSLAQFPSTNTVPSLGLVQSPGPFFPPQGYNSSQMFTFGEEIKAGVNLHCYRLVPDEESCFRKLFWKLLENRKLSHLPFAFLWVFSTVLGTPSPLVFLIVTCEPPHRETLWGLLLEKPPSRESEEFGYKYILKLTCCLGVCIYLSLTHTFLYF